MQTYFACNNSRRRSKCSRSFRAGAIIGSPNKLNPTRNVIVLINISLGNSKAAAARVDRSAIRMRGQLDVKGGFGESALLLRQIIFPLIWLLWRFMAYLLNLS